MYETKDVEIIYTKFCRRILNVKMSTNLCGLYGALGRIPFKIQQKLNILVKISSATMTLNSNFFS